MDLPLRRLNSKEGILFLSKRIYVADKKAARSRLFLQIASSNLENLENLI